MQTMTAPTRRPAPAEPARRIENPVQHDAVTFLET